MSSEQLIVLLIFAILTILQSVSRARKRPPTAPEEPNAERFPSEFEQEPEPQEPEPQTWAPTYPPQYPPAPYPSTTYPTAPEPVIVPEFPPLGYTPPPPRPVARPAVQHLEATRTTRPAERRPITPRNAMKVRLLPGDHAGLRRAVALRVILGPPRSLAPDDQ